MLIDGKYPYSDSLPDDLKERFMNWAYLFVDTVNSKAPELNIYVLWQSTLNLQKELFNRFEYNPKVKIIKIEMISNYVIKGILDKAKQYKEEHNFREALLKYRRILFIEGYNIPALMGMAESYFALNIYGKSIETLNRIIAINPDYHGAYNNLSLCFSEINNSKKAKEYAKLALSYQPNNPDYLFNLGCIYNEQGDYEQALVQFRKALKITPDDEEIYHSIALNYLKCHQDELVAELYMEALIRNPELVSCFWNDNLLLDLDITTELKYDLLSFGAEYGDKKARQCLDEKTWLE